jgi:hypothetical protein
MSAFGREEKGGAEINSKKNDPGDAAGVVSSMKSIDQYSSGSPKDCLLLRSFIRSLTAAMMK